VLNTLHDWKAEAIIYMERGRGGFNWRWKVGDVHLSSFSSFFFFHHLFHVGWVQYISDRSKETEVGGIGCFVVSSFTYIMGRCDG